MANRKDTKFLIIHCSATRPTMDVGVKEIDRWHKAQGWRKIGYHFVIRRKGELEVGRAINEVGAHAVGPAPKESGSDSKNWWNENSIGLCWVGGVNNDTLGPEDNRTPEQKDRMLATIRFLVSLYPTIKILGHRDVPDVKKACPSFDVALFLKENKLESYAR